MIHRTKPVNLARLSRHPGGLVILRLILALNDIASINEYWRRLTREMPVVWGRRPTFDELEGFDRSRQPALQGHVRYAIRMMIGHLHEAEKITSEVLTAPALSNDVAFFRRDSSRAALIVRVQTLFDSPKFKTHVRGPRNNLVFHYNHANGSKVLARAVKRRIENARWPSSAQVSTDPDYSRITAGDDVLDTALAEFMGVPSGEDYSTRFIDEAGYHMELGKAFAEFAGAFIEYAFDRHGIFQSGGR